MRSSEPRRKKPMSRVVPTHQPLPPSFVHEREILICHHGTRVLGYLPVKIVTFCVRRISTSAIMAQEAGSFIVLRYPATQADGPTNRRVGDEGRPA